MHNTSKASGLTPSSLPQGEPAHDAVAVRPGRIIDGYDDHSLIAQLRDCGTASWRKRAELYLQLPAPYRFDVAVAADLAHTGDPEDIVAALAKLVYEHPQWRPVACGARYVPCQVGTTETWGVIDLHDGDKAGGIDWVTDDEGHAALRWDSFEDAATAAAQLTDNERNGQPVGIAQPPWKASVVRPGDRIKGTCVTYGTPEAGAVIQVIGPIRTPDCGGYRYLIRDDEGREHTVFAELLI